MAQPQSSAVPPAPPVGPSCDFRKEVRFAVVMYGGVSLAIYINGIAQELLRLVRATAQAPDQPGRLLFSQATGTEAVYRKIGQLLGKSRPAGANWKTVLDGLTDQDPVCVRFVVDILSGTSAGGINGIYLAKALANGQSLDELKKLWVSEGAIEVLINDADSVKDVPGLSAQKPPQALLNGQRMYRKLLAAFEGMESGQPAGPLVDQLDLFVTTTDIRGLPLPLKLADGVVWERRHKNVFRFRYDRGDEISDFRAEHAPMLAFAARCTSSFPFAFEPFELGDLDELLPGGLPEEKVADWKGDYFPAYHMPAGTSFKPHAYDAAARSFGDGGYLDNKPFGHAIDTLAKRSSELPVDRKLIYVEPSPEHPEDQPAPPGRPNVLENVSAALSLARYETIREDLQRILARNRLIERVEHYMSEIENDFDLSQSFLRPTDSFTATDLRQRIQDFGPSYGGYHRLKVSAVTDDVATWVTLAAGFDLQSDQFLAIRYLARAWRERHFTPIVLREDKQAAPGAGEATENEFLRAYDLGYRIRRLRFVLSRIDQIGRLDGRSAKILTDRGHALPRQEDEINEFRAGLSGLRKQLNDVLRDLRRVSEDLEATGKDNPIRQALAALSIGSADLMKILDGASNGEAATERAGALCDHRAEAFKAFATRLETLLRDHTEPASDRCWKALTPPDVAPRFAALACELARHYYEKYEVYDLISFPILYSTDVGDELSPVGVYRCSPEDAVSIIDEHRSGRHKLAGTALGHFGAFLDRGFRRNDILWGRLDGAERLITVLLPGDEYKDARAALLKDAQLAILEEELQTLDQGQLGEIVAKAWLATGSRETNEIALRALAERELGATANPGLQAALRQTLIGVNSEKILQFYRDEFACPRDINSKLAIDSLARSTQLIGGILEDLGNRYQQDRRPGAWIARLGGWFWGFVEVAVPRSVPNLIFRHWLRLLYLFEALLIVGGTIFRSDSVVQQLGWMTLGFTLLLNLLLFVLTDLIKGRRRWPYGVAVGVTFVLVFLAILGSMHLPDTLHTVRETLHGWAMQVANFFRKP